MDDNKHLFAEMETAAKRTQLGDMCEQGELDGEHVQRLTTATYQIATQALHQGNQDVLQTLQQPKVHRKNGMEWAVSAETEAIHRRKEEAARRYEAQGKHMPRHERDAFAKEAKAGAARDAEAWLHAEVEKLV